MKGEHWTITEIYRHELYFADSLGRKKYRFFKQQHMQMISAQLQSHPNVCGFHTFHAAFRSSSSIMEKLLAFKILLYSVL